MILAELAMEAGLPDGVLNIVHGAHDITNDICDDDDIKAISFVGANEAGTHIYARAASKGKCVQADIGGKNHAIIMPDASMDATLNVLVAAGFGVAGMALSTAIFAGGSMPWEGELVERAKALKVNVGTDANADLGPVITKEALRFYSSYDLIVCNIKIINNPQCHLKFDSAKRIKVDNITISSPKNSPNTDAIHLNGGLSLVFRDSLSRYL